MSILNDAFDSLTPLYNALGEQANNSIEPILDEPLYIEHNTLSGVEERPLFKRTQSMRMNSILSESMIEEETGEFEIKNFIPFMAKIISHTSADDFGSDEFPVRWYYSWEEMRLDQTEFTYDSLIPRDCGVLCEGDEDDSQTRALNVMEWDNNLSCVAPGVCIDGCDYPEEWRLQPIGGLTCYVKPIVIMYKVRQNDFGSFRYIFQAENDHDGTCPV